MAIKKQLPRKHIGKKCTEEQKKTIEKIQEAKKITWIEAKHEFFERLEQEKETGEIKLLKKTESGKALDTETGAEYTGDGETLLKVPVREVEKKENIKKRKKNLTIEEAKLGVTMVINKEECKQLGIPNNTLTTEAIKTIRTKLGLKNKKR